MESTICSHSSKEDNDTGAGTYEAGPRPEEILAEILKAKREAFEVGRPLSRVVMPMSYYRLLQEYHASLGEAPYDTFEYLSRYEIMGLPIFIDNESELRIE